MSGGRSFGQEDPLSDQDRIAELERKIPILLDRIAQCDQISAKLETYAATMLSLASDLSAAHAKIKELELNLSIVSNSHTQLVDKVNKVEDFSKKTDVDLVAAIAMASSADREAYLKFMDKTKESLDSLSEAINKKSDQVDLEILEANLRNSFDVYTKSFTGQIADMAGRISNYTTKISDQIKDYTSAEDLKIFKGEVADMVGTGIGLAKQIIDQAKHDFGEQLAVVSEKFSVESGKISQNFPDFDVLRQDFDKKVQDLALDSQNATIRTKNSDQKIVNLEKRIENIDLRLKHQELQRG